MARWRQSTRGNESPTVGGDYVRDSFNAHHTHLTPGWTEVIGNNYKLRDEIYTLEQSAAATRNRLFSTERRRSAWRTVAIFSSVALLVLTLIFWNTRPEQQPKQSTFLPTTSETTPATEEPITLPTIRQEVPRCMPGKWITLFGSFKDGDTIQDVIDKATAVTELQNWPFDLKYSGTTKSCDTLLDRYIILYVGPLNSAEEAAAVCRELGWTTDAEDVRNECIGKALDPNLKFKTVWPSGRLIK